MDEGDTDNSVFENTYNLRISDDVKSGTYPINVKVYYDSKVADIETVNLAVEKCVEIVTPVEEEPLVEVVTTPSAGKEAVQPPVTKISFRDTSEYVTLLIILFVLLAGGVIFLIGAAIILTKKK